MSLLYAIAAALEFFPLRRHCTKLVTGINQSVSIQRDEAQPSKSCKRLVQERSFYPPGSTRACEGTSADENLGKSRSWLAGQMFSCHAGLLEALDPKWSCNFQKPEVTTVCMSAPFCCCHSSKTNLILNALSLGITQIPKPHLSHDQWWVCSSIVRSKPLQNTKT